MSKLKEIGKDIRLYFIAAPIMAIYAFFYGLKNSRRLSMLIEFYGRQKAVDTINGELDEIQDRLCKILRLL